MNVANKWLPGRPSHWRFTKKVNTETNVMLIVGYRMERISMYTDTM